MPKKDHDGDFQRSRTKKNKNEHSGDNTAITSTYTTKDHSDENENKNKGESKSEDDEKSAIENEEKDLEITKNATNVLNDLEKKILIKEHKIKPEGKKRKNKKEEKNKKKSKTMVKPMESPSLFQGDIILTNAQAKRLVKTEMKKARKKKIRFPKYRSKLRFMRE
uniref:Ribosome biogenesis protein NOP53 n=1 Tax=Strongyloides papillosus TaxID=174720 RepID=A0A0N5BZD8_STREA